MGAMMPKPRYWDRASQMVGLGDVSFLFLLDFIFYIF